MTGIQIDERFLSFLYFLPFFFLSLAVHEYAHARIAYIKGDSTAKDQGRLTLNPLKHIDLFGSVIIPVMAFASGFMIIGWAKPVPVNRSNFKNHLKDDALVSVAGPLSNFLLAVFFFLVLIVTERLLPAGGSQFLDILWLGVYFNIFLFAFNLLPIPPLDGSHLVYDLFPNKFTAKMQSFGFYGTFILLLFIYSPLWGFFVKIINFIIGLFIKIRELL